MRLVNSETGENISNGEIVKNLRGETCTVTGNRLPSEEEPEGRVLVDLPGRLNVAYYPSVIGAAWK